jgi:hypothetical protein
MPLYESMCVNHECSAFEEIVETFHHHVTPADENPACTVCAQPTKRILSPFSAPWTGDLNRFNQAGKSDLSGGVDGGHYAYRVRSSRMADGKPERVLIKTRQDQTEYCPRGRARGSVRPQPEPWGECGRQTLLDKIEGQLGLAWPRSGTTQRRHRKTSTNILTSTWTPSVKCSSKYTPPSRKVLYKTLMVCGIYPPILRISGIPRSA